MKVESRPTQLSSFKRWARLCILYLCLAPAFSQAQSQAINELVDQSVTVEAGDTYQSLSLKFFNTVGLWRHIAEYNQLDPTRALIVGQSLQIPSIVSRPREYADVVYSHGDAIYISHISGDEEPISTSLKLYVGDKIDTGRTGFVSVEFRTGTVINLQPRTQVQLVALNCLESDSICFIEINADSGTFDSTVESRTQKTDFRITTPTASAAVRGTTFDFDTSAQSTIVGVTNGLVELIAGTDSVALDRGFGLKAVPNEALGQPVALLPPPTYTNIPPRVTEEDILGVWPITDASSYEWSISTDPVGRQILNRTRNQQTSNQLISLPAGGYYSSARGIDNDGLKGFSSIQKINVAAIVDKAPVELEANRTDSLLVVNVQNPEDAVGYEIQLAENPSFIDAVSVDIGSSGEARFALPSGAVYVRARVLITPLEVSRYGPSITVD